MKILACNEKCPMKIPGSNEKYPMKIPGSNEKLLRIPRHFMKRFQS
jgi:hypothetical protein